MADPLIEDLSGSGNVYSVEDGHRTLGVPKFLAFFAVLGARILVHQGSAYYSDSGFLGQSLLGNTPQIRIFGVAKGNQPIHHSTPVSANPCENLFARAQECPIIPIITCTGLIMGTYLERKNAA